MVDDMIAIWVDHFYAVIVLPSMLTGNYDTKCTNVYAIHYTHNKENISLDVMSKIV